MKFLIAILMTAPFFILLYASQMSGFRKFIEFSINGILKLNFSDDRINHIRQFIQFGIVGVTNTLINYIVYAILLFLGIHYLAANISGFCVSILNAYYFNNRLVFINNSGSPRNHLKIFLKTFASYAGTSLILSNLLLVLLIQLVHINAYIAPAVILLITLPLNFILNKVWAFNDKKTVQ